ncbi:MAG: osmotically inducible protein OsmC [Micavibrio sp.]|nr:osmotically inducible protein OsmC [Micavibrio sp.]
MAENLRTAHVSENGESAFGVDITVSGFEIKGDEPIESGGGNLGPAPYDILLAALGECTCMTVRWYARQQNWPLEKVEVILTHHKEGRTDHFTKDISLYGDSLSGEQREKLIEIAAKCPVQRTLEGTPVIATHKA